MVRVKINTISRLALGVCLVTFLTACATSASRYPDQPVVAVDSKIRLNISAEIPPEQDRIYVQDQRLLSREAVDIDRVYCSVVMHGYRQSSRPGLQLKPDELTVTRVRLYNDYVFNPVNYVNNDQNFYQPSFGVDYRTEVYLKSADQPEIKSLICTKHQILYQTRGPYPERLQFEATLGELVDLR